MRARQARGQSLVETVLGLWVFVVIFAFGIFFAEVGALSLQVAEAANFALWDSTGRGTQPTGQIKRLWTREDDSSTKAAAEAQLRYQDFDGRRAVDRGTTPVQQVFTRAMPMEVRCSSNTGLTLGLGPEHAASAGGASPLATAMDNVGGNRGVACSASSVMQVFNAPSTDSAPGLSSPLRICSSTQGTGENGQCRGELVVLLDDWGMASEEEGQQCPLAKNGGTTCANSHYYEWVKGLFIANGGQVSAGTALAGLVGGPPGGAGRNEGHFYMSYVGMENGFKERTGISHAGSQRDWETTPWIESGLPYPAIAAMRQNRWLGK